jgi:hypothetical protein
MLKMDTFMAMRAILLMCFLGFSTSLFAGGDTLGVQQVTDFVIDGKGSHANWQQGDWVPLTKLDKGADAYHTRFKILYSEKGVYVLFHGIDRKTTSVYMNDFENLFNGDVFEVFFHTDPSTPLYFEYEINAYNKELVLLIPHLDKRVMGWVPWHYNGERKVIKQVDVVREYGHMQSWTAEMFIPFSLLSPLGNVPAKKGMCWNANFCRLDYDEGNMIKWSWSPIQTSFHEYKKYKTIRFD